jgi:hypothetical protein
VLAGGVAVSGIELVSGEVADVESVVEGVESADDCEESVAGGGVPTGVVCAKAKLSGENVREKSTEIVIACVEVRRTVLSR